MNITPQFLAEGDKYQKIYMPKTKLNPSYQDWADTKTAAQELGLTPRHLRHLRSQGLFKLGKHYRIASSPWVLRATYLWHIERCGAALEVPMGYRKTYQSTKK